MQHREVDYLEEALDLFGNMMEGRQLPPRHAISRALDAGPPLNERWIPAGGSGTLQQSCCSSELAKGCSAAAQSADSHWKGNPSKYQADGSAQLGYFPPSGAHQGAWAPPAIDFHAFAQHAHPWAHCEPTPVENRSPFSRYNQLQCASQLSTPFSQQPGGPGPLTLGPEHLLGWPVLEMPSNPCRLTGGRPEQASRPPAPAQSARMHSTPIFAPVWASDPSKDVGFKRRHSAPDPQGGRAGRKKKPVSLGARKQVKVLRTPGRQGIEQRSGGSNFEELRVKYDFKRVVSGGEDRFDMKTCQNLDCDPAERRHLLRVRSNQLWDHL